VRLTKSQKQQKRQAEATRTRILCAIISLISEGIDRVDGKVEWKRKKESEQWAKVKRWTDEAWSSCGMTTIGSRFIKSYDKDQRAAQDAVCDVLCADKWGHDDFLAYYIACSFVIDDTIRRGLLTPAQRRPWTYMAQTLVTMIQMLLPAGSDAAEEQGVRLGMRLEEIYFEQHMETLKWAA
jgi:hypothetical protein